MSASGGLAWYGFLDYYWSLWSKSATASAGARCQVQGPWLDWWVGLDPGTASPETGTGRYLSTYRCTHVPTPSKQQPGQTGLPIEGSLPPPVASLGTLDRTSPATCGHGPLGAADSAVCQGVLPSRRQRLVDESMKYGTAQHTGRKEGSQVRTLQLWNPSWREVHHLHSPFLFLSARSCREALVLNTSVIPSWTRQGQERGRKKEEGKGLVFFQIEISTQNISRDWEPGGSKMSRQDCSIRAGMADTEKDHHAQISQYSPRPMTNPHLPSTPLPSLPFPPFPSLHHIILHAIAHPTVPDYEKTTSIPCALVPYPTLPYSNTVHSTVQCMHSPSSVQRPITPHQPVWATAACRTTSRAWRDSPHWVPLMSLGCFCLPNACLARRVLLEECQYSPVMSSRAMPACPPQPPSIPASAL